MWRVIYQAVQHGISLSKIFVIFSLICFLPQLFIAREKRSHVPVVRTITTDDFKLAVELISPEYMRHICAKKDPSCALLTNEAAQVYAGRTSQQLLAQQAIDVNAVFELTQMEYREVTQMLQQCQSYDLLFVDVQDAGSKTMHVVQALIEAAASHNFPRIIVLDRPNLLGPKVEGSLQIAAHGMLAEKFPLRTGMTIGELVHYYTVRINRQLPIEVVAMQNYDRNACLPKHEQAVSLYQKAYSYTVCDLMGQVQPFDIGMATELAYTVIALPQDIEFCKKNWYELQVQLRAMAIDSTLCSYYSPIRKEYCTGLKLHIPDIAAVDSFNALLATLMFFKQTGLPLGFTQHFDNLVGTPAVRQYVEGKMSQAEFKFAINHELEQFYRQAFNVFMYHPLPHVVMI